MQLATESVELARENFEQGLINQLELIQSQLDLTRAQTARAGAYYDYQSAHARLDRATGSRFHLQSHETKGVGEITNTAQ